jgi:hypothetical protein
MENKGLLFIPDISGFTQFVNGVEIEHSRMIIQELLEGIINTNDIGLEISEIEGDAILFYKFGEAPVLDTLYQQVEKMFCEFHSSLIAYEQRRYCQCKACRLAATLSLKIITHYGEFSSYNVKNFQKLIGKDLIVAHQLLKNDIENHEYWLVTSNLSNNVKPIGLTQWMHWDAAFKETELGTIPFHYTPLSELKKELKVEPPPVFDPSDKIKIFSLSEMYDTDMITLLHAVGDFNHRSSWMQGVKQVQEVHHYLPRIGMRCRCIMENGEQVIFISSSYSFQPDKVEFTEREENNDNFIHYIVQKNGPDQSKLTIDYYLSKGLFKGMIFKFTQGNKTRELMDQSLKNLRLLANTLIIPKTSEEF